MGIIDTKKTVAVIKREIKKQVAYKQDHNKQNPHVAIVSVEGNAVHDAEIKFFQEACHEMGFDVSVYKNKESISKEDFMEVIRFVTKDNEIHSVIIKKPLPAQLTKEETFALIPPHKDILQNGKEKHPGFLSEKTGAVIALLENNKIDVSDKNCVVLTKDTESADDMVAGLSGHVLFQSCRISGYTTQEQKLIPLLKQADILIIDVDQSKFLKKEMIKKDTVIIDLGIHKVISTQHENGYEIIGDVDFDEVSKQSKFITSSPADMQDLFLTISLQNILKSADYHL